MEYSGDEGKLIHEKNQQQKISWHCPFKDSDKRRSYFVVRGTGTAVNGAEGGPCADMM